MEIRCDVPVAPGELRETAVALLGVHRSGPQVAKLRRDQAASGAVKTGSGKQ
jgi:hypothetical protein